MASTRPQTNAKINTSMQTPEGSMSFVASFFPEVSVFFIMGLRRQNQQEQRMGCFLVGSGFSTPKQFLICAHVKTAW